MFACSWSTPFTTYLSVQGVPESESAMQPIRMSTNPMSLPPMPSETIRVDELSALNCGGVSRYCHVVMAVVVAPLQLTSLIDTPSVRAASRA